MPTRQLLIMRHAKSSWEAGVARDIDRPLNERGRRDAPRVGAWLASQGLAPELIVSSPAQRTRETTALLGAALGSHAPPVEWEEAIYEASLEDLLGVVRALPARRRRVLLVGHNPGLEELLLHLAPADLNARVGGKLMPTGALYCLEFDEDWDRIGPHAGRLVDWTHPKRLG